jgi:hypothetical protein
MHNQIGKQRLLSVGRASGQLRTHRAFHGRTIHSPNLVNLLTDIVFTTTQEHIQRMSKQLPEMDYCELDTR